MPSTAYEARPVRKPLRLSHGLIVVAGGAACGCILAELASFPEMGQAILTPSTQAALPRWPAGGWAALAAAAAALLWLFEGRRLAKATQVDLAEALRRDAFSFAPLLSLYLVYLVYVDKTLTPSLTYYPFFLIPLALACSLGWKLCLVPASAMPPARARWAVRLAIGVFVAVFATLNVLQIRSVNVPFTDSGYFERMLWNMFHGNILHACEHEHIFLGTRVRFVQFLVAPLYWLWPCMESLTLVQVVAVGLGASAVFLLSKRVLRDDRLSLACAVAYLLHPGTQYLVSDASGEIVRLGTLGMPVALWALLWVEERRYSLACAAFAFALTCREEYALVLAAAGLYVMLRRRDDRGSRETWLGSCFIGVGAAWFVLALFVVIPHFSGTPFGGFKYYDFAEATGQAHSGSPRALGQAAGRMLGAVFSWEKLGFLLLLVVPLCLLPVLAATRLALALPAAMVCLLSSRYQASSILFHYHAAVLPFLYFALPFGARRVLGRVAKYSCSSASCSRGIAWALVAASSISTILAGKSPISLAFHDTRSPYHYGNLYLKTPAAREARRAATWIPPDAAVCATEFVATLFTHHAECWTFPDRVGEAEWAVIDRNDRWLKRELGAAGTDALPPIQRRWLPKPHWSLVSDREGIGVFQRTGMRAPRPPQNSQVERRP